MFLLVLASLIIGVDLYLLNAQRLGGDPLPMPFGYGAAVVLSGSMEPALSVDDLLLIKKNQEYQIGDIVVYQNRTNLIVHRVVAVGDGTVQTQGDANNTPDPPTEISSVKGAVIAAIPKFGIVVRAVRSPIGMVGLLAGIAALFEWSYWKGRIKDEEELDRIREEIRRLRQETEQER